MAPPQPVLQAEAEAHAELDGVSKWLLTPVPVGLEQWLFRDHLLPVTLIALVIGFICGDNSYNVVVSLPIIGAVVVATVMLLKNARDESSRGRGSTGSR